MILHVQIPDQLLFNPPRSFSTGDEDFSTDEDFSPGGAIKTGGE
jgi:hypothetical protein